MRQDRIENSGPTLVSIPATRTHNPQRSGRLLLETSRVARVDGSVVDDSALGVRESIPLDHGALHVVRDAHQMVDPVLMEAGQARNDSTIHMTDDDERHRKSGRNALKDGVVVVDAAFNAVFADVSQQS